MLSKITCMLIFSLGITASAFADKTKRATLVYDAGFTGGQLSSARTMENLKLTFSKASIDSEGNVIALERRKSGSHQFFSRPAKLATYKKLKLEAGKYVLSSVNFEFEGRFRSYCFPEKTILFNIDENAVSYLGQFHFAAPSTSPSGVDDFIPLEGLARDLEQSRLNKYWNYDDATLSKYEVVDVANPESLCDARAHRVSLFEGDLDVNRIVLKTTRNKRSAAGSQRR